MFSAGTTACRVITAEAFRAELAAGPALAALLGLLFLSSLEGEVASAVAGRAAVCGLLEPAGRPYERRERAALAGLYDRLELPAVTACASACSRAAGVAGALPAARSLCSGSTQRKSVLCHMYMH